MQFYMIGFDTTSFKLEADILTVNDNDIYDEIVKVLNCEILEFIDYNDEIVMIIDENGKFKKYNPVFNIETSDGICLEVAGRILFARNIENEFSTDIGSIFMEDISYLRANLDIKLLGIVK